MWHDEIPARVGHVVVRRRLGPAHPAPDRPAACHRAVPSRLRAASAGAAAPAERGRARAAAAPACRLQAGSHSRLHQFHHRKTDDPMKFKAMLAAGALLAGAATLSAQTLPPPQNVLQLQASGTVEVQQDLLTMNLTTARDGAD